MEWIDIHVPKCNTNNWTKAAKECYDIGCVCSKCEIRKWIEGTCYMKNTVRELVKRHGIPPEVIE